MFHQAVLQRVAAAIHLCRKIICEKKSIKVVQVVQLQEVTVAIKIGEPIKYK